MTVALVILVLLAFAGSAVCAFFFCEWLATPESDSDSSGEPTK